MTVLIFSPRYHQVNLSNTATAFRVIILLTITIIVSTISGLAYASPDTVYVQARSAVIVQQPKLLSSVIKKVSYGDSLELLSSEAGWSKVRGPQNINGYIHNSALTNRRLILNARASKGAAIEDSEVSLAGKGFSPEVEKQLSFKDSTLNFRGVDAMEKISISPDQIKAFIKIGKLNQNLY